MTTTPSYEYYGMMAEFWDLFRGDTSTWDDRFFFLDVVKKYGQPVLDVGCGTGRILLDFMQQGIDIDGVDNSPEMLALCKQKAEKLDLTPAVYQQEMHQLSLPGGVLVMSFMTLWKEGDPLESESTREAVRPGDGATIRCSTYTRFDPATGFEHALERYEIIRGGKVVGSEKHRQSPATRSYAQEQAAALYREAALEDIQVFHEFTFESVKPQDTLFSVLGFKPR